MLVKFLKDESGATAIEYGILAGLIAVFIIGAVSLLGTELSGVFNRISEVLKGIVSAAPAPDSGGSDG